jgi:hypothetical protein
MKKEITALLLIVLCISGTASFSQTKILVSKKSTPAIAPKQALALKTFTLADVKNTGDKKFAETDLIKTVSGKSITVAEYLKRVNKLEEEINKKGYSLRNLSVGPTNLIYKPVVLDQARITSLNMDINKNVKPLSIQQADNNKLFIQTSNISTLKTTATVNKINPDLFASLKSRLASKVIGPETIDQTYSIDKLLKPLADKINDAIGNDDVDFKLVAASLDVKSYAEPPDGSTTSVSPDLLSGTNSEYKVAVSFGANIKGSFGLPISLTIPVATMNGEFISPSNSTKKLSRKVVVNLLGRSLFNKTSSVNTNTLNEQDEQELDLSEIISSIPLNTVNFLDWIPSIGFNTDLSTSGAVGCMYQANMTRNGVDAYIGPTYSVRLRVAASYGIEDVAEGGIEGIVTLLKGGLGFGGNAGLSYDGSKWTLINTANVVSTLEALKGEVDFFVRYPDLSNWSCLGPCIAKSTIPIYQTPTAFTLKGTLLEEDKGKTLNW